MKWLSLFGAGKERNEGDKNELPRSENGGSHVIRNRKDLRFLEEFIASSKFPKPTGTGNDALQFGIEAHERNDLERATFLFALAAKAGVPLGVFLFALSLRSCWGCKKNDKLAFSLLQQSAEFAIAEIRFASSKDASDETDDGANSVQRAASRFTRTLSRSSSRRARSATAASSGIASSLPEETASCDTLGRFRQTAIAELTAALVELAQCFRHGSGCPKSKLAFLYYVEIAARLGDRDALVQLGDCYLLGNCVKRDKREAAYWYRLANEAGADLYNMHWVYKDKYQ